MGHLRRAGGHGRAVLQGDGERERTAEVGVRPERAGDDVPDLLQLQSLAGNDAVGSLLRVQRQTLDEELANIDDDAASIQAVLRGAERGAAQAGLQEGRAAFERGDFLHAAEQFETAAQEATGSDRAALLQNAALSYQRQGDRVGVPGQGGEDDRRRGPVEQEEIMRTFQLGNDAFVSGDLSGALTVFRQLYERAPVSQVVWNLAMVEYRLGAYADALQYFQDFQSRGGTGADATSFIRRCEQRLASTPQLSERDLAALDESPEESMQAVVTDATRADMQSETMAATEQGMRFFAAHEFRAALESFGSANEAMPDNPAVAWDLARTLQASGQFEAAIEAYRRIFR